MSKNKWYNSHFGYGVGMFLILGGVGTCTYLEKKGQAELEAVRSLVEQEADLNGNGIPDKFYIIDGKIAVSELDGKEVKLSLDELLGVLEE